MSTQNKTQKGMTWADLLTVGFVLLKVIGLFDVSWWVIWCPMYTQIIVSAIWALFIDNSKQRQKQRSDRNFDELIYKLNNSFKGTQYSNELKNQYRIIKLRKRKGK